MPDAALPSPVAGDETMSAGTAVLGMVTSTLPAASMQRRYSSANFAALQQASCAASRALTADSNKA